MRLRYAVFGTVGALLTLLAAVALLVPGLVTSGPLAALLDGVTSIDPETAMLAVGGVAGLYVLVAARSSGDPQTRAGPAAERFAAAEEFPPEAVTANRRERTAAAMDDAIDRAVDAGGRSLREIRGQLLETATAAYADAAGVDRERASAAIAAGEWTDDETAAAFLAAEGGPDPTLAARMRLWLVPERERRRRIERATRAIERLAGEP